MERTVVHIVGGESRSRAEQARIVFALGHHAEIYGGPDELFALAPRQGVVLAEDDGSSGFATAMIDRAARAGLCLPLVVTAEVAEVERAVAAIKAGALDYIGLPLEMNEFARRLQAVASEAGIHSERLQREVYARRMVGRLSPREREVLELLNEGCSNKEIARLLTISPRTVEIHRGNMMTKLDAGHVADAIRLWIDSRLQTEKRRGSLHLLDESAPLPRHTRSRAAEYWDSYGLDRRRQRQ